ncbi:MAG: ubiquinone biosynthesis accessory factor UbiJ, partial [Aeromonas sp.]
MPLDVMVTAVIETGLNQLLVLDRQSPERLRKLVGKVLKLELRELKPLWFVFSERRLDVLVQHEGEADAVLSLSLTALGLLKDPSALTRYIREEKLDLSGDPQLVQAFSMLLGEL